MTFLALMLHGIWMLCTEKNKLVVCWFREASAIRSIVRAPLYHMDMLPKLPARCFGRYHAHLRTTRYLSPSDVARVVVHCFCVGFTSCNAPIAGYSLPGAWFVALHSARNDSRARAPETLKGVQGARTLV